MLRFLELASEPTVELALVLLGALRCALYPGCRVLWRAAAQRASLWGAYCALTNSLAGMNALSCPS